VAEKRVHGRHDGGMRFTLRTGSGHDLILDDGVGDAGPRPTETLVAALVACTAMDVASLLAKKRQVVTSYTIDALAHQRDEYPQVFTRIDLTHVVEGPGVAIAAVKRCIELSASRYCPISAMISAGPTEIHHRYRVRDSATASSRWMEGEVMVTGPDQAATIQAE
jgi:putative redox protein